MVRSLVILTALVGVGCSGVETEAKRDAQPSHVAPEGMTYVPGGEVVIGSDDGNPDERPAKSVTVSGFFIDTYEVTNDQFAEFVEATGYVTVAEIAPLAEDFPGAPPEMLKPGALVFVTGEGWSFVHGAQWRHPTGLDSTIEGKGNHPAVQVCWEDAVAYANWAKKRLPTEAEWEHAARSGSKRTKYIWGDEEFDDKEPQANIWQGLFPNENLNTDGFLTTSPVGSFPPNGIGLFDMAGNVWEWCADWYRPDSYATMATTDPTGPESSFDPNEPSVPKRVLRGGSFLCADCYCRGYRPSARMKSSPDTGLFHSGFRCASDAP